MANYFYETDDETGIYLEDDPTFEEPEIPSSIVVPDTEEQIASLPVQDAASLPVEDPISIPMEDPIVDTNPFQGENDIVKKEEIERKTESMMKVSLMIKKWWICWFVSFVVAAAIFGTVYLLLSGDETVSTSSDSSPENNNGIFDIKTTSVPSSIPSSSPIAAPTFQPSDATASDNQGNKPIATTSKPTSAPITAKPTNTPTTLTPSSSPSTEQYSRIVPLLKSVSRNPEFLDDITSWNYVAADWVKNNSTIDLLSDEKIIQRYVAVLLDLSLHGSFSLSLPSVDECQWLGITCNNDNKFSAITSILWNDQGMTGRIPNDIGLLSALQTLDLSENDLIGIIPNGLYNCAQLQYLYLYRNQIGGSLSTWIGTLSNLVQLFLGRNYLTGSLPSELGGLMDGFTSTKPLGMSKYVITLQIIRSLSFFLLPYILTYFVVFLMTLQNG
jgi:Leucine Rich Repeat